MLKAAENEHAHAEEKREIFAQLVRVGAVALHADVDHHVAENGEDERAEQRFGELERADGLCAGVERGKARELLERGNDRRADQVAKPDDRQRFCIGRVIVEKIADLARKQVQSARADDKKADGEEKRADDRIFHRQKYRSAKADDHTGQNRGEKDLFHEVRSSKPSDGFYSTVKRRAL